MTLMLVVIAAASCFGQAPLPPTAEEAERLTSLIHGSRRSPLEASPVAIQVPNPEWNTDYLIGRLWYVLTLDSVPTGGCKISLWDPPVHTRSMTLRSWRE